MRKRGRNSTGGLEVGGVAKRGVSPVEPAQRLRELWSHRHSLIAVITLACIAAYVLRRFLVGLPEETARWPLWLALAVGGVPLVLELILRLVKREFGSDLLAGISVVTAALLGEYLAAALVVLMLSGGEALEAFAVRRASSALDALARRLPLVAHRKAAAGVREVSVEEIKIGDELVVLPHEICPVDGVVVVGHGSMDEAYLTGEPYLISKSVGSDVISGSINGEAALSIRATRLPIDSRYSRIMRVMQESQQQRPRLRRLGDELGAFYTPLAVAIAVAAWLASGQSIRFLAVLVIATPCPLLIAIPVAIIGAISLAARRSIIIRDPAVLERIGGCGTMIFDKTGTLTYGKPTLVDQIVAPGFDRAEVLRRVASLEQYSKHPLAAPVLEAARHARIPLLPAERVEERPGQGMLGTIEGHAIRVTSSRTLLVEQTGMKAELPPKGVGLECVVLIDGRYAATFRFRDEPRPEGAAFINHLGPRHGFKKVMLVSGDRLSEVEHLAQQVGITNVHAGKSPEEKLAIVRAESAADRTIYVGDGINDAPAMVAATVGLAMGQGSEVTTEAAGAVIMDNKLARVDELLHIGARMRRIALQSAVGGMALSLAGMVVAALGYLPPVGGAIVQEAIDVIAVLHALRAGWPTSALTDFRAHD